ncbi:Uncharacterised protein [uncultured archaeon]|nr:Uncharacterised protein [uncultured archaeon]
MHDGDDEGIVHVIGKRIHHVVRKCATTRSLGRFLLIVLVFVGSGELALVLAEAAFAARLVSTTDAVTILIQGFTTLTNGLTVGVLDFGLGLDFDCTFATLFIGSVVSGVGGLIGRSEAVQIFIVNYFAVSTKPFISSGFILHVNSAILADGLHYVGVVWSMNVVYRCGLVSPKVLVLVFTREFFAEAEHAGIHSISRTFFTHRSPGLIFHVNTVNDTRCGFMATVRALVHRASGVRAFARFGRNLCGSDVLVRR